MKSNINELITKYVIISKKIKKINIPNIVGTLQTYLSKGNYQYYIKIKNPEKFCVLSNKTLPVQFSID